VVEALAALTGRANENTNRSPVRDKMTISQESQTLDDGLKITRIGKLWNSQVSLWVIFFVAFLLGCGSARLVPTMDADRGIFVSIGERLLAGDRLYSGAYDNKDPLFYYLVAAQRFWDPLPNISLS
jgi:hypothetical protein